MDDEPDTNKLLQQLSELRNQVASEASNRGAERSEAGGDPVAQEVENMFAYLAFRRHDLRSMQRELMSLGLSSLGRLESRVLPALDATIASLAAIAHADPSFRRPSIADFFRGENALAKAADGLLGPARKQRRGRIMVTLPTEAGDDPHFVLGLAKRGLDLVRINCAHDDDHVWTSMVENTRWAGQQVNRHIPVLMDIAGPKIRTAKVGCDRKAAVGDLIRLLAEGEPYQNDAVPFSIVVSPPEIVTRLRPGDRVRYNDGKLEGKIDNCSNGEAILRVTLN